MARILGLMRSYIYSHFGQTKFLAIYPASCVTEEGNGCLEHNKINKILSHSLGFAEVQMEFREFRVKGVSSAPENNGQSVAHRSREIEARVPPLLCLSRIMKTIAAKKL